jgi:hypothetical protein
MSYARALYVELGIYHKASVTTGAWLGDSVKPLRVPYELETWQRPGRSDRVSDSNLLDSFSRESGQLRETNMEVDFLGI